MQPSEQVVDGVAGVVFLRNEPSIHRKYDRLEAELRAYVEGPPG